MKLKHLFFTLLLILFLCGQAEGAETTYYISQSGTGAGTTLATPDSLTDYMAGALSETDDDEIYFLDGITDQLTARIGGTSTAITLRGDYPGRECTIDNDAGEGSGIFAVNLSNLTIKGFTTTGNATTGINIRAIGVATTNVWVEDCVSLSNGHNGIAFSADAGTAGTLTNSGARRCTTYLNGIIGVGAASGATGIIIEDHVSYTDAQTTDIAGIYASGWISTITDSDWVNTGGTIYEYPDSDEHLDTADTVVDVIWNVGATTVWLTQEATNTPGSVSTNEWAQDADKVYIDIGQDPDGKTIYIIHRYTDVDVTNCTVYSTNKVSGEGQGICYDIGASGTASGNTSYNNEGANFVAHRTKDVIFQNNKVWGAGTRGIALNGLGTGCFVDNNTTRGNTTDGIAGYNSALATVRNNISVSNGAEGIDQDSGTLTASYNCSYGNTGANWEGVSKGTGAVELDPQFRNTANAATFGLKLRGGSPCINAGTSGGSIPSTDIEGKDWIGNNEMGCHRYAVVETLPSDDD